MSNPSPLIPQGTFQAQASKGASNVRIAVATIVAIHVVFFGGLLLQGCKRDPQTTLANAETNAINALTETNLALPQLESSSLYYTNAGNLPGEAGTLAGASSNLPPADGSPFAGQQFGTANTPDTLWQATNLQSVTHGISSSGVDSSVGPTREYTIAKGDYFGKIAKANQTTVSALRNANPGVDPVKIRPGQKINIPAPIVSAQSSTLSAPSGTSGQPGLGAGVAGTYSVKAGDTLTKIARNHGITVGQLRAANNLKTSRVNVGQKLKIPAKSNAGTQSVNQGASNPSSNPGF